MIISMPRLVLWSMAGAACAPAGGAFDEAAREAIEASVDSATRGFHAAELAGDAERTIAYLAPDFYMYNNGVRSDYDSVVAGIRSSFGTLTHFESEWREVAIRALGPDAALVSLVFRDSLVPATGRPMRYTGPTTLIWERSAGAWRIVFADADHYPVTGDDAPGAVP